MATVLTAIVCVFIVCHTPKAALNLYEVGTVGCNFKKCKICLDLVIASPIYCFKSFPSLNLPFLGDYPLTRIFLTMLCPLLIVWLLFATFFLPILQTYISDIFYKYFFGKLGRFIFLSIFKLIFCQLCEIIFWQKYIVKPLGLLDRNSYNLTSRKLTV